MLQVFLARTRQKEVEYYDVFLVVRGNENPNVGRLSLFENTGGNKKAI
ncbi:MAG: hypothetical protein IJV22_00650 [Bacteroidales bacterium]|nr:hypothetical protein [Bacteroidales bacterium]